VKPLLARDPGAGLRQGTHGGGWRWGFLFELRLGVETIAKADTIVPLMTSESGTPEAPCSWTLLLGPGPALDEALPLLEAIAATSAADHPIGLRRLQSWQGLLCDFSKVGRIVIDTGSIESKHVGLLEAFVNHRTGWELVLLGTDPGSAGARELLRHERVNWLPAPLEVRALQALLESPESEFPPPSPAGGARPPAEAPSPAPKGDDLLTRVEAILRDGEGPGPAATRPPTQAERSPIQLQAPNLSELFTQVGALPPETGSLPGPDHPVVAAPEAAVQPAHDKDEPPSPPAPYFRNQVADLADLVQCIDHSLEIADAAEEDDEKVMRLEELRLEVARLAQFTRTLSFLAAPPVVGTQRFDLAPMLTEMLTARRSEPDAPRYLIRTPDVEDSLPVRADRVLLSQALDALLYLSHWCASSEGTVRVEGQHLDASDEVQVSIRFPADELSDMKVGQILEPYGLRRRLPELGANALGAASGILQGQQGRLDLRRHGNGGLEWLLHLPAAE
jgi:hypothetical protein